MLKLEDDFYTQQESDIDWIIDELIESREEIEYTLKILDYIWF